MGYPGSRARRVLSKLGVSIPAIKKRLECYISSGKAPPSAGQDNQCSVIVLRLARGAMIFKAARAPRGAALKAYRPIRAEKANSPRPIPQDLTPAAAVLQWPDRLFPPQPLPLSRGRRVGVFV